MDGRPVRHQGVCLNNKGVAGLAGQGESYGSVTDLVLNPPEALAKQWRESVGENRSPAMLLSRYSLVVEDVSPDSCFGLLCWLALRCGIDRQVFLQGPVAAWTAAVRYWESTGMADDPFTSWAALLSAFSHSFIPPAGFESPSIDLSSAWREALRFTVHLLKTQTHPHGVPALWDWQAYTRAAAALHGERQDYQLSLPQAETFQLLVPLVGTDDSRKLLVDAYFSMEAAPSGAKKIFIRTDREHSYLKQGFALMGLCSPGERLRGQGGDMTVSVNPNTGIYLKDLWQALEQLEKKR